MYYALTVNQDRIITGVHESGTPITEATFEENPSLADDTVVALNERMAFRTGEHILCYNEDGTRKPDLWCIENGYMDLPPNKEIINGELVDKEIPAEKQPQTLKEYIQTLANEAKTAAETKFTSMTPLMTELVKGKPADVVIRTAAFILDWDKGDYHLDDVRMWKNQPKRCCQAHDSTNNPDCTPDVASLWAPYHGTTKETALVWLKPTGAHDQYKSGEYMIWTDGKTYRAKMDTVYTPVEYAQAWEVA